MHLVDPKWSINRNGYAHSCLALGFAHDATKSEKGPQKKKLLFGTLSDDNSMVLIF